MTFGASASERRHLTRKPIESGLMVIVRSLGRDHVDLAIFVKTVFYQSIHTKHGGTVKDMDLIALARAVSFHLHNMLTHGAMRKFDCVCFFLDQSATRSHDFIQISLAIRWRYGFKNGLVS